MESILKKVLRNNVYNTETKEGKHETYYSET